MTVLFFFSKFEQEDGVWWDELALIDERGTLRDVMFDFVIDDNDFFLFMIWLSEYRPACE